MLEFGGVECVVMIKRRIAGISVSDQKPKLARNKIRAFWHAVHIHQQLEIRRSSMMGQRVFDILNQQHAT